jgi:hypothetical protein
VTRSIDKEPEGASKSYIHIITARKVKAKEIILKIFIVIGYILNIIP